MKTQLSRDTFDALKYYSGVYQQQGRMLTDADWNELVEIIKYQFKESQDDIIASGIPRHSDGKRVVELVGSGSTKTIMIHPNDVYADGVHGKIRGLGDNQNGSIEFGHQEDLKIPGSYTQLTDNYLLYADIFDIPIIALQDPEIRDAGLKGADTCTRTRRVVQIKQCRNGLDPENEADNPTIGNAEIDLKITNRIGDTDDCDPCATSITAKPNIGNYLFRIEVHEVKHLQNAPDEITLKWSSENGAETYETGKEPESFKTGNWVYEFFSNASESRMGAHLSSDTSVLKNSVVLHETYPADPTTIGAGNNYVRRWDGYVTLKSDVSPWALVKGVDLNETLEVGAGNQPGKILIDSTKIRIQLSQLTLTVYHDGKDFVKGDYWYDELRSDNPDHVPSNLIMDHAKPVGIKHHYLLLGRVTGGSLESLVEGKPTWRRLNFPPITDINAKEVGYSPDCNSGARDPLFNSVDHYSVKRALDAICEMSARHIGYDTTCNHGNRDPLFTSAQNTVKKALDHLCELDAGHVGFTPGSDCSVLGSNVHTVEEALYKLCKLDRGGTGCRVTKRPDQALDEVLKPLADKKIVCICLLPGIHDFKDMDIGGDKFNHFHILGCGTASIINMTGSAGFKFNELKQVVFENVFIKSKNQANIIFIQCDEVKFKDCRITGDNLFKKPLIGIDGAVVRLIDNHISVNVKEARKKVENIMSFSAPLTSLFTLRSGATFRLASVRRDLTAISAMSTRDRKKLVTKLNAAAASTENKAFIKSTGISEPLKLFAASLADANIDGKAIADRVKEVFEKIENGWAISINEVSNKAMMEGNEITGIVSIGKGKPTLKMPGFSSDQRLAIAIRRRLGGAIKGTRVRSELIFGKNRLSRIVIGSSIFDELVKLASGDGAATFSGWFPLKCHFYNNVIDNDRNIIASVKLTITGNHFEKLSTDSGYVFGSEAFYQNNHGTSKTIINNVVNKFLPKPANNFNFVKIVPDS